MTTTLIIPAYNEEQRLPPFLRSIAAYLHQQPGQIDQVIVVDDGSRDATAQVARSFQPRLPNLQVISYRPNRGKGAAIKAGIEAASGQLIVFMDADGATAIGEWPKMIAALRDHDLAVGSRWMDTSQTKRSSAFRHVAGWSNRHYMRLFGLGEIDTMCGFKGYQANVARELFATLLQPRWLFDTEIAYKAVLKGYRVKNFPIRWESKVGSKLSATALLTTAWQMWPLLWKIRRHVATSSEHKPPT